MSTFYGGEQLSQVVSLSGTTTSVAGRVLTVYTVPVGFYGILKFFYVGLNTSVYLSASSNTNSYVINPSQTMNESSVSNQGYLIKSLTEDWRQSKKNFTPNSATSSTAQDARGVYDLYLSSGDRIVNTELNNSLSLRWEGELHLFKKP